MISNLDTAKVKERWGSMKPDGPLRYVLRFAKRVSDRNIHQYFDISSMKYIKIHLICTKD